MTIVVTVTKAKTEISTITMIKDPTAVLGWKTSKIGGCLKW